MEGPARTIFFVFLFVSGNLVGCQCPGATQRKSDPATRNPLGDAEITLREASQFHEKLYETCMDMRVGLRYAGALADRPQFSGAMQVWDPLTWYVTTPPTTDVAQVVCTIHLTASKPASGEFVEVDLGVRRFYAVLVDVSPSDARMPVEALHGRTFQDLLVKLQRMSSSAPLDEGAPKRQRHVGNY